MNRLQRYKIYLLRKKYKKKCKNKPCQNIILYDSLLDTLVLCPKCKGITNKQNTSGYIGVKKVSKNRYMSYIRINGQQIYLGIFQHKFRAAIVRDLFMVENNIDLVLNFEIDYSKSIDELNE